MVLANLMLLAAFLIFMLARSSCSRSRAAMGGDDFACRLLI